MFISTMEIILILVVMMKYKVLSIVPGIKTSANSGCYYYYSCPSPPLLQLLFPPRPTLWVLLLHEEQLGLDLAMPSSPCSP